MKKIVLFSILLLIPIFQTHCGSSNNDQGLGTAPTITDAYFWNIGYNHESDILYLGQGWLYRLHIHCYDPDLDMVSLYMTIYDPTDPSVPQSGPHFLQLSPQSLEEMIYITEGFEPEGEPRERMLELQMEDAKGNVSNIYRLYFSIEEHS